MKRTHLAYICIAAAEVVAVLNDTVFHTLQRQAAMWYQTGAVLAYQLIPIALIGILLAVGAYLQRQNKSVTLHIGLIVLNIVLLLIHQFIAFFWEYDSICLIMGFSVGGVICGLIDRKIDSK